MKIYVFGYSHSGTTILRKLIGDHSLVDELTYETIYPPPCAEGRHIVFKSGAIPTDIHDGCKQVMIMKNPWDVMGSLCLRFGESNFSGMFLKQLQRYSKHLEYFVTNNKGYKLRYEYLTKGGIEGVFEYLRLEYEGPKDRKSSHDFPPGTDIDIQEDHTVKNNIKRAEQINKPLTDMTGNSAKHLPKEYLDSFKLFPIIDEVYGEFEHLGNRRW